MQLCYLLYNSIELFLFTLINNICIVSPYHRLIGRNHHNIQIVNLIKLCCLCICCSCHACQFIIKPEIVLEGDCGKSLVLICNLNILLCLNRLMQAVAPSPSRHKPSCKFINNKNLAVFNNIINILLKKRMSFQCLNNMMDNLYIGDIIHIAKAKHLLNLFIANISKRNAPCLFFYCIICLFF